MAVERACEVHIPEFTPVEVFGAGTLLETLPTDRGFSITADSDRFGLGVLVHVALTRGVELGTDGEVTEFIENEKVKIEGESHLATTEVGLELEEHTELGGTVVRYMVGVHCKGGIFGKGNEKVVGRHLNKNLKSFADDYQNRVVGMLGGQLLAAA